MLKRYWNHVKKELLFIQEVGVISSHFRLIYGLTCMGNALKNDLS